MLLGGGMHTCHGVFENWTSSKHRSSPPTGEDRTWVLSNYLWPRSHFCSLYLEDTSHFTSFLISFSCSFSSVVIPCSSLKPSYLLPTTLLLESWLYLLQNKRVRVMCGKHWALGAGERWRNVPSEAVTVNGRWLIQHHYLYSVTKALGGGVIARPQLMKEDVCIIHQGNFWFHSHTVFISDMYPSQRAL